MLNKILLSMLIFFSSFTVADTVHDKLAEPVLSAISEGQYFGLSSLVFKGNKYISEADLEARDLYFNTILSTTGKVYGYELLQEASISDIYVTRYYIFRFERNPVLLKIEFYKPNDKWVITSLGLDSDLDEYLDKEVIAKIKTNSSDTGQ